jgi:hypothetical protein
MRILITGAGEVGFLIASELCQVAGDGCKDLAGKFS